MAQPTSFRVFLSAVTNELASQRREVARVLRRKGIEVRDQEHFRQGGATLAEALRDYIHECDAVILLVGEQCGSLVEAEHAAVLGENAWFDRFQAASGCSQASYTQWEFLLAKQFGRKTYTFLTADGFLPDRPSRDTSQQQECQAKYRAWIEQTGEHREPLSTKGKLIEDVLVLPFPELARGKPIQLPFPSLGKLFKGRTEFLARLRASLLRSDDGTATAIVGKAALYGLGGIGKTRLAIEYAWQHEDDYTALLFVTADSPEALRRNLAELCGPLVLDLPEQHVPEEEVRYAAAIRWLQHNPGWFLILDNLDSSEAAKAAEDLLAKLGGGHVVLTSRLANWSGSVEPLALDVLTVEDAADFLLTRTESKRRQTADDPQQARELAEELGQLALALEQAGAYICQRRLTLAGYRTAWQEQHDKVIEWFDEREMKYPRSVAVTWQTTVGQLSEAARELLQTLAWFGPEAIPESLLESRLSLRESASGVAGVESSSPQASQLGARQASTPATQSEPAKCDPYELLAELDAWSLVTREGDSPTFSVHRLVQDITRRSLRDDPDHTILQAALNWLANSFSGNADDVRTWPILEPLAPHVRAATTHGEQAGIVEPTTELLGRLGTLLWAKALHNEAEDLDRRALALDESHFGPESMQVAERLNNLAQTLHATNRLAEAEPLMRRALAIDEQSYGAEHPRVAIRLNNLAWLLKETNRMAEAEPRMRRALAIDEQSFGVEHPDVARDLNNLALLLQETNRLAEAEPLMRRALAIDEQSYGAEHPNVARDLNNLAMLLKETNRLADAEPLMRRALAIDEQSYGAEHPLVAIRLNNLARLLQDTNRLAEAEPLMRRMVEIFHKFGQTTGHEHPNMQAGLRNYRNGLAAMNLSEDEITDRLRTISDE